MHFSGPITLDAYGDHWGFFLSYGFSMKLHAGLYHGSYDKSSYVKYAAILIRIKAAA